MKINSENNSEDMIFVFIICEKRKFLFYEFSVKNLAQKVCNVVYLSEITMRSLTFLARTADITYCSDIALFFFCTRRQVDYNLVQHFCVAISRVFYCFTCYLGSFSRYTIFTQYYT